MCVSDVFGVGALIYYLLARKPPFGSDTLVDAVLRARQGRCVLPSEIFGPEAVPRELERIAIKAMARHRDDRYWSIAELADDLVRFLRGGGAFPRITFVAGATIVSEGDAGHEAYLIVSGACDVTKRVGGGDQVVRRMGPGDTFGETALLTGEPRSATVIAVEDTVVDMVTEQSLAHEIEAMKPWMAAFVRTLATRFREIDAARHGGDG